VDKLVDNIKTIFVKLYGEQLTKPHTTLVECHAFDEYFDVQIEELDQTSTKVPSTTITAGAIPLEEEIIPTNTGDEPPVAPGLTYRGRHLNGPQDALSADESTPAMTPNGSRPGTPSNHLLSAKGGPIAKISRRARKAKNQTSAPASSGDEAPRKKKITAKKGRKWDADGFADEDDDVQLDYSTKAQATSDSEAEGRSTALDEIDSNTWGSTSKGKFVLKDLGDEVHEILASEAEKAAGVSAISGLFRNVVGGKTLTKEDLDKAMKGMEEHLLQKNVAREAAVRLCEGVEKELIGVKTGSFESTFQPDPLPRAQY
jgi:signal recognition particle receptor subunit alpha